jgi:mannose-6-phosphate isomerase-like protein (cupin superfamily)
MKKKTSFGTLEILLERDREIISEFLIFEKEGRGHIHNKWEICYIVGGSGIIVNGEGKIDVKKGDVCKIPPGNNHWMIPKDNLEILIVYSENI